MHNHNLGEFCQVCISVAVVGAFIVTVYATNFYSEWKRTTK